MKTIILACCCLLAAAWVRAQVIQVPGDYPTIQQGINAAVPGDTVLVAEGIYYERINFMGKKPLTVTSQFILDGDRNHIVNTVIDGSLIPFVNNASVVYFILGEDTTSTLCGFTIRNGRGTLYHHNGEMTRAGGGIFISGSGARIINNHITQNKVCYNPLLNNVKAFSGGGIATEWEASDAWVILEHNTIDYNTSIGGKDETSAGGVLLSCNARVAHNDISNNTCIAHLESPAIGGGLVIATDQQWGLTVVAIVENNTIENNLLQAEENFASHGACLLQNVVGILRYNDLMDNTVISGNSSGGIGGAGIYLPMEGSMVTGNNFARNTSNAWCGGLNIETSQAHTGAWGVIVENNYFIGNHAREGGAFTVFNIPVCLQNNVFSGNSAELRAGAIMAWKDYPVPVPYMIRLINNSFYGNSAAYGGALYSVRSKPLIVNSIFYGDIAQTGQEIYAPYGKDTIEIAFTNIDFNEIIGHYKDGSGNFTRDPFYEDFELLTIGTDSPCLNSGTEAYTCSCGNVQCCPAYDIDGIPRPENGGVDVGAHELLFAGVPAPSLNESAQWCRVYPNPAADQVSFAYEITENGHCLLEVYDASGKLVATLLNSDQSQGRHLLQWNTEALNTGIYFYRLSGKGQHVVTSGKFIRL